STRETSTNNMVGVTGQKSRGSAEGVK
ncbi:hypothetical protein A2U01_0077547, partial [Trifolium medium]|nr:hypothetical protein [Trifolium medium]